MTQSHVSSKAFKLSYINVAYINCKQQRVVEFTFWNPVSQRKKEYKNSEH